MTFVKLNLEIYVVQIDQNLFTMFCLIYSI